MKVGIFTANSVQKIHPRIQMEMDILSAAGYEVELFRTTTKRDTIFWELINWLFLKYYKWGAISNFRKKIVTVDIVHIYDLQLLPLAKSARRLNKKVVYETLDDNVHLHFHALSTILKPLLLIKSMVIKRMAKSEFSRAKTCNAVLVNSPNLREKFAEGKARYLPYASPLEPSLGVSYRENVPTAFLYLGKLTKSKGAVEYLQLVRNFNIPLFLFGEGYDEEAKRLQNEPGVKVMGNLNAIELRIALKELAAQYNLIGLSIIHSDNESYRLQEANKDIDYIALGLPFIGNDRPPTLAKIQQGVGVLISDREAVKGLIDNQDYKYTACQDACRKLAQMYTADKFKEDLLACYHHVIEGN